MILLKQQLYLETRPPQQILRWLNYTTNQMNFKTYNAF